MSGTTTIHLERTPRPTVLRWVCRRDDLDATPVPPATSALGKLLHDGVVSSTGFERGDLLVEFPSASDIESSERVAAVHRAVLDSLATDCWTTPSGRSEVTIRRRT